MKYILLVVSIISLSSCDKTTELPFSIGQTIKNETSSSLKLRYWREKKLVYSRQIKPNSAIDTLFTTEGLVGFVPIDPNASIDSVTILIDDKIYLSFKKVFATDCTKTKNIFCKEYYEEKIISESYKSYIYRITMDDLKNAKKI